MQLLGSLHVGVAGKQNGRLASTLGLANHIGPGHGLACIQDHHLHVQAPNVHVTVTCTCRCRFSLLFYV